MGNLHIYIPRWAGYVVRMGAMKNPYITLFLNPEWNRLRSRPRRRWEDNSRMDLRETGLEVVEWIFWLWIRSSGGLL
jgi:hypothetical protein